MTLVQACGISISIYGLNSIYGKLKNAFAATKIINYVMDTTYKCVIQPISCLHLFVVFRNIVINSEKVLIYQNQMNMN